MQLIKIYKMQVKNNQEFRTKAYKIFDIATNIASTEKEWCK